MRSSRFLITNKKQGSQGRKVFTELFFKFQMRDKIRFWSKTYAKKKKIRHQIDECPVELSFEIVKASRQIIRFFSISSPQDRITFANFFPFLPLSLLFFVFPTVPWGAFFPLELLKEVEGVTQSVCVLPSCLRENIVTWNEFPEDKNTVTR